MLSTHSLCRLGAVIAITAGCASSGEIPDLSLRAEPALEQTGSASEVAVLGVQRPLPHAFLSHYAINSWINWNSQTVIHQVVVSHYARGDDWLSWVNAKGGGGEALDYTPVAMEDRACAYGPCAPYQIFGATIPDSLLRANASGYSVNFMVQSLCESSMTGTRAGSFSPGCTGTSRVRRIVVPLDSAMIAKQLAATEQVWGMRPR